MRIDLKTAWLEALRSGEYKQCQNALNHSDDGRRIDSYCCLGVLCVISDKIVPKDDWKGFDHHTGPHTSYLIKMNDELNMSFLEIADWIEENIDEISN